VSSCAKRILLPGALDCVVRVRWTGSLLAILVCLLYVQVWPTVGGFTVRLEDVLIIVMWAAVLCKGCTSGTMRYRLSIVDIPLALWVMMIAVGVVVSLQQPYDAETHKNAIVNGGRLALACSLFPLSRAWPGSASSKWRALVRASLGISLLTTAVALAQIAYWDGWLPFSLPHWLIEFKPGANTTRGREIFALYVGNTGAHTFSGMLSLQALLVWLLAWSTRSLRKRYLLLFYFAVLFLILIRVSVRNSILGLIFSVICVTLYGPLRYRDRSSFVIRAGVIVVFALLIPALLLSIAPDTYFFERVRQAIPYLEGGRLAVSRGSNIYGRIDYYKAAWQMFVAHPVLGVGFYGYQAQSTAYLGSHIVHAHNSYLQTMAEMGVIGSVAFLWLAHALGQLLRNRWHAAVSNKELRLVWSQASGAVLFLAFTALFSNTLWAPQYLTVLACTLGALVDLGTSQ
jgi:O-antigen ligase